MNGNIWHQLITLSWLHKPSKWYKNLFSSCTNSALWLLCVSLISKTNFKRFLGTQRQYQWNQSYLHTPCGRVTWCWACTTWLHPCVRTTSVKPSLLASGSEPTLTLKMRWYFPEKHFLRRWMENFTSTASAFATGPEPNLTLNNDYKILKSHMFLWNHLLSRWMETFDINCFSLCNWSRTNSHIGKWQVVL